MKYIILIIILTIISNVGLTQIRDTVSIKNIEYEFVIDTITHKIIQYKVIDKETFIEKIYLGFSTPVNYGNYTQKIIYDASEWGKISLGYDFGHKAITLGAYVSLGRLYKRNDNVDFRPF